MQPRIIDGKYEIGRELGKGGMGAVFEARHLLTRRKVALKLVLAETLARKKPEDALRRFEREARAAGSIESRHVVSVLDTGIDSATGDHYIVMELLVGEDLRELIHRVGTLPESLVLSIACQVCKGLHRAHERGIIHRDIKAANIYLARRDDGQIEVKILDFGIAKLRDDPLASSDGHELTRSGSVMGSPLYMSPEQATGSRKLDVRSDIWSLGVVMYEALTGVTPHGSQPLGAVILAICSQPARPIRDRAPWVSPETAALVHKALALETGQRHASAAEMQAAIEAFLPEGSSVHESTLNALSAENAPRLTENTSRSAESNEPETPGTAPTQTTVEAVTYGSGAGTKRSTSARRRLAVPLALGAGVVLLGAVANRWPSHTGSPSAPDASESVAASRSAEKPVPPPVTSAAATPHPASPAASAVMTSASRSEKPPERPAPARGNRKPRDVHGASSPAPAVSSAAPRTPPPPPSTPAGNEPAIDRHFD